MLQIKQNLCSRCRTKVKPTFVSPYTIITNILCISCEKKAQRDIEALLNSYKNRVIVITTKVGDGYEHTYGIRRPGMEPIGIEKGRVFDYLGPINETKILNTIEVNDTLIEELFITNNIGKTHYDYIRAEEYRTLIKLLEELIPKDQVSIWRFMRNITE